MKRKINRIILIGLLVGFCISPSILKSQLVQPDNSISSILDSKVKEVFSLFNWYSYDDSNICDLDQVKTIPSKCNTLKRGNESLQKPQNNSDTIPLKIEPNAHKKLKRKNYRNMPVIIQTRI